MTEGKSLISFGDLTKPATVLIEKVSNAIGVIFEPNRIIRAAKAQSEAEIIRANTSLEISEIQQRGIDRFIQQEGRKQENIESIVSQSIEFISESAKVEDLDEDWIVNFFNNCDIVSDNELQTLWARLLAGEASKPNTFSKRTVNLVASLEKVEAELFTNLCQFAWSFNTFQPILLEPENELFIKNGINFGNLNHLASIGLITVSSTGGYVQRGISPKSAFSYFGHRTGLSNPDYKNKNKNKNKSEFELGNVLFTQIGKELANICGAEKNEPYYEHIISIWYKLGYQPYSSLIDEKTPILVP